MSEIFNKHFGGDGGKEIKIVYPYSIGGRAGARLDQKLLMGYRMVVLEEI